MSVARSILCTGVIALACIVPLQVTATEAVQDAEEQVDEGIKKFGYLTGLARGCVKPEQHAGLLPGQSYSTNNRLTSGLSPVTDLFIFRSYSSMNCRASNSTLLSRSRNAGIGMLITFSRLQLLLELFQSFQSTETKRNRRNVV